MLKTFLILYLKRTKKGVISFFIVLSLILSIGTMIEQLFSTIVVALSFLIVYFGYLEFRQIRTCIIIDTCSLQEIFLSEVQLPATKGNKFTKTYRNWLMKYALENDVEIKYIFNFVSHLNIVCCYCFFNIIPMLIIFVTSTLYFPRDFALIITLSFLAISLGIFIFLEQKTAKQKYKELDSEIKRIIFEEQTGYSPIIKNRFAFKYKAWLIMNERKTF